MCVVLIDGRAHVSDIGCNIIPLLRYGSLSSGNKHPFAKNHHYPGPFVSQARCGTRPTATHCNRVCSSLPLPVADYLPLYLQLWLQNNKLITIIIIMLHSVSQPQRAIAHFHAPAHTHQERDEQQSHEHRAIAGGVQQHSIPFPAPDIACCCHLHMLWQHDKSAVCHMRDAIAIHEHFPIVDSSCVVGGGSPQHHTTRAQAALLKLMP